MSVDQIGKNSLQDFLKYKSKVTICNNEVFSRIIYEHDTTQEVIVNVQKFDSTLTSLWETDIRQVSIPAAQYVSVYNNNDKTIIYYLSHGDVLLHIKIYEKATQVYSNATYPILDILPLNNAFFHFINWHQKDYMVVINDSNNDNVIDNTYILSFINDSSFLLEKTFSGGKRVQCFNENDSLMYFVLGKDSINYLSTYNVSFSLIDSTKCMRNKNGNLIVINNYKTVNPDYWYFGYYFVYPNYYPYAMKTSYPLAIRDNKIDAKVSLKIFPNPANNILTIESIYNKFNRIQIFDCNGRNVYTDNTGSNKINVSNLTSGLYFIKALAADGNILSTKFYKE